MQSYWKCTSCWDNAQIDEHEHEHEHDGCHDGMDDDDSFFWMLAFSLLI